MDPKKSSPKKMDVSSAPKAAPQQTNTPQTPTTKPKTNGLAIAGFVLVLLGFIPILGLVGLILAIVALTQIKKTKEGGKGLAIAAIIIYIVEIVLGIILVVSLFTIFNTALKKNGVNVSSNGNVTVKNDKGESLSVGNNTKVPDGFPSDVPIYTPSDVVTSLKTSSGYNVTLVTTDTAQKVSDFYKSQMPANGWTKEDTESVFSANVVQAYNKGDKVAEILIGNGSGTSNNANNGKTSINITVANKNSE
jgi:hypothetical protein